MENHQRIYLDHAATTPLCPEARDAMIRCMTAIPGNASGIYDSAREAKRYLEQARCGSRPGILHAIRMRSISTSGGSESDNWALKGVAFDQARQPYRYDAP